MFPVGVIPILATLLFLTANCEKLRHDRRGSALGRNILGFSIAFVFALVAILLGGVISGQMTTVFSNLNVTEPWTSLMGTAESYTNTAMTLVLISIIIAGVVIIINVVKGGLGGLT